MQLSGFVLILTFITSLFLGIFIIYKNRRDLRNVTFGVFTLTMATWVLVNFFADAAQTTEQATFWARMAIVTPSFMPFLLLLFSNIFPTQEKPLSKIHWFLLSIPALIFLLLSPTHLNVEREIITETGRELIVGPLYTPFLVYFALYIVGTIFNLFRKYRKSTGLEKLQIQYLVLGLIAAVGFALLFSVLLPILGISSLISFSPLASLFLVGSVSYAIVRHRLLDIEVIIRRSLVYSTLLASLIAIYSGLVFVLNSFFLPGETGVFPRVTDVIAIILVAFTIDPLRRVIERSTDKVFFKKRYNAQETIKQLSETLVSEIDLARLVGEIKKVLTESLKVSKLSIYIRSDHEFFPAAIVNDFPTSLGTAVEKKHLITKYLVDHHDILIMDELERMQKEGKRLDPQLADAMKLLSKAGVEVVVPLIVKGNLNGAMFLGEKLSQDIYSNTDIGFLEILSRQAALSLENAKLYEEQKLYGVRLTKEVERATSDLRHANERLKELDELKDEFMSIASHELRTPMTAIKSYVWLALHGKVSEKDPKVRTYLDKVFESSERMISMINDMLNVSRIETGRLKLEILPISIWKVAEEVKDELNARAAEAGVDIIIKKDTFAPLVMADRDKLTEIYTNLIGNSLKFTQSGGKVTVSAQKKGNVVEVYIADTGVGIAKENIGKLFKKYGKLNESYATVSSSTGTGLGLYITKQYLEKMDGYIKVESTLGRGTNFTFALPIATGKDLQKHAEEEEVPTGVFLNPKLAKTFAAHEEAVKAEIGRSPSKK
ncbi:MAG: ATP-binding protein [Candidatus Woykebacteria bacterium]